MPNIRVETSYTVTDGSDVIFVAPCNCNEITGLKVCYPDGEKEFVFKDAHGNTLTGIGNLFSKGAYVKAILDVKNGFAYLQNADTNAYLEKNFAKKADAVQKTEAGGEIFNDYIGNTADGIAAHVEGQDNAGGIKGFHVSSVDFETETDTTYVLRLYIDDADLEDKAYEVYSIGDYIQWDAKQHHYGKVQIAGLLWESASLLYVIVDKNVSLALDADPTENYIYVVGKNFGEVIPANVGIHAEGLENTATGKAAHTEGYKNKSIGNYSHTEGRENTAHYCAHAEGMGTEALGDYAHSEGRLSKALEYGAHAEGLYTQAKARGSHTEGIATTAIDEGQHAGGKHNLPVHGPWVIGNGDENGHSNAAQMDWDGNVRFDGDIVAFGCNGKEGLSLKELSTLVGDTPISTQIQNALNYPIEKLYASNEAELEVALSNFMKQMVDGSTKSFEVIPQIYAENFSSFVNESTVITDVQTTVGGSVSWNGAITPAGWSATIMSGSVILQPHVEEDGNVCIKMTPRDTGRMQVMYRIPEDIYNSLVDGGKYKVSVRYKGQGNDFNAQLEAKAAATWSVVPVTLVNGEWVTAEYEFAVDKSFGSLTLTFGIAWPGGTKGALYIDDICLEKAVDAKLFDGKSAIGQLYRADKHNAAVRLTTYGSAGNSLYDKNLYDGAWLPLKNVADNYLPKNTTPSDIGAMARQAEMYPYVSGDNDETRVNAWLDGLLSNMSIGQVLPIRFSVYPAISGQTLSGFLFNHEGGYAEVLATTYLGAIYHKCRWADRSPAWQPTICMNLINGTPADAGHTHDDRYYQPGGATVLTNQNWNQYINTSGGGSAGMVREFDSGYLYRGEFDSSKCPGGSFSQDSKTQIFSFNSDASKFYTIMISNDTDYREDGTNDDLCPLSGSISSTTVDYMAIKKVMEARASFNYAAECEVWIPTSGASVKVTITISGNTVTFKVDPTKCRFVNICGYY